jgi:hypothetical protein
MGDQRNTVKHSPSGKNFKDDQEGLLDKIDDALPAAGRQSG